MANYIHNSMNVQKNQFCSPTLANQAMNFISRFFSSNNRKKIFFQVLKGLLKWVGVFCLFVAILCRCTCMVHSSNWFLFWFLPFCFVLGCIRICSRCLMWLYVRCTFVMRLFLFRIYLYVILSWIVHYAQQQAPAQRIFLHLFIFSYFY